MAELHHGWWSSKASDQFGNSTYGRSPRLNRNFIRTQDGKLFEVTCTAPNKDYENQYKWDDKVYLGTGEYVSGYELTDEEKLEGRKNTISMFPENQTPAIQSLIKSLTIDFKKLNEPRP